MRFHCDPGVGVGRCRVEASKASWGCSWCVYLAGFSYASLSLKRLGRLLCVSTN